jgi:hypothetical protein
MTPLERRLSALEMRLASHSGCAVIVMLDGETPEVAAKRLGLSSLAGMICVRQILDSRDWCVLAKAQQAELVRSAHRNGVCRSSTSLEGTSP